MLGAALMRDLVIADQQPIRLAARHAEFLLVDFLEQLALVELCCPFQIAPDLGPGHVEHAQLDPGRAVGRLGQIGEAAPCRLQPPEARMAADASTCSEISSSSAASTRSA